MVNQRTDCTAICTQSPTGESEQRRNSGLESRALPDGLGQSRTETEPTGHARAQSCVRGVSERVALDAGYHLGCKTVLVSRQIPGEGHVLEFDVHPLVGGPPGLSETVAHHNGVGWVPDRDASRGNIKAAYRLLHKAGLVTYRGLRSALDRPVWESITEGGQL